MKINKFDTFKNNLKDKYNLSDDTKITLFKNPLHYKILFLEDINPTHIKLVYAKKWNSKSNCEKIAKIIIPSIIFAEIITLFFFISLQYLTLFSSFIVIGFYLSNCNKLYNFAFIKKFFSYFDKKLVLKYS